MPDSTETDEESSSSIYNRAFWLAFLANLTLVTANTLTYRFAEFIRFLGGTEEFTGRLIAVGLIGSLIWRLFLGQAMDRFGVRAVWMVSTLLYLVGATLVTFSTDLGPTLWTGRILFTIGLASMATAALSHVQGLAPPHRRTEVIASYGAAGFIGLILGAQLGDLVFGLFPNAERLFPVLFGLTTLLGAGHGLLGVLMTRDIRHTRPQATPAVHSLFCRYWPRRILTVTLMMGLVLTVTTIFLTRFATEQGIGGIRMFFSVYAMTAFLMRLFTRLWSRYSRHQLIAFAMTSHTLGLLLLLTVTREWLFLPPAICFGIGHSLLFPCVVSLGTGAFPEQYRGTATTLCLAAIDLGTMVTAPIVGWMIDHYGFHPMLTLSAVIMGGATIYYTAVTWTLIDDETQVPTPRLHQAEKMPAVTGTTPMRPSRRDVRQRPATTKAG